MRLALVFVWGGAPRIRWDYGTLRGVIPGRGLGCYSGVGLQSFAGYLGQALVFFWGGALRGGKRVNSYFQGVFC